MSVAAQLDQTLRDAGVPIVGVSIGSLHDRRTWSILFDASATPGDRGRANQIVNTLVVDDAAWQLHEGRMAMADPALQALLLALWEAIPAPNATLEQCRDRAAALFSKHRRVPQK